VLKHMANEEGVEADKEEGQKPTRRNRRRRPAAAADSRSGLSAWFFGTENFRAAIQNLGPHIRHRLPNLGPVIRCEPLDLGLVIRHGLPNLGPD
jgi:hypothetical protein